MENVIIIGAGNAGLSTAFRLMERGCNRLVLLEALDSVVGYRNVSDVSED